MIKLNEIYEKFLSDDALMQINVQKDPIKKIELILKQNNKNPIYWDDIIKSFNANNNSYIQVWHFKDDLITQSVKKGYKTILSDGFYLDKQIPGN